MIGRSAHSGTREQPRTRLATVAGIVAIGFGALTLMSGGNVLFGGQEARATAGRVVDFVLWFNFASGFAYVAIGIGLLARRRWAARGAVALTLAIAAVGAAFAVHVWLGGPYEMRTVAAMTLRLVAWISIAAIACRTLACIGKPNAV